MKYKFACVANMSTILLLAVTLAIPVPAQQSTSPHILTKPDVNYPIHFDISPPLREMAIRASKQLGAPLALPVRHPKLQLLMEEAGRNQAREDGALQTQGGPLVLANIGLNFLGVGAGFLDYMVNDAPPDANLAVGDTQVVQWVNVSYAIFDKATGAIIQGPILGNSFWSGFGGRCEFSNGGDPIIQWDKIAHRWVASQNTFVPSGRGNLTCLAISTTPDATGTYYRFAFPQPHFPDYPKLGIWPDAYYQSQNNFACDCSSFLGAYACAYESAKLLVGDATAKQVCFQTGTFDDSLLPSDLDSAASPPAPGQPEVYLGSIDNGTPNIYEYLFHVDFTTPSNSTFTGEGGTMPIPGVASFSLACGGFNACIPQPSPGELLDSLGDRLMYRLAYRDFSGDHQTWVVTHDVTAGSSVGNRWYEFRAPESSTSLSVYQQGTFAPDGNFRWMGSIAMDQSGDMLLGYSLSSSSVRPSVNYTGRIPGDALGMMETEASIIAGTGVQEQTDGRWGDYNSMAIDEADDCTFWYTNEYYTLIGTFDWSTQLASLKYPFCGSTTPDFLISAMPATQSVRRGDRTTYTVTVTELIGFAGTVNLSLTGCPDHTRCTFNPTSVTLPPSPASSTLTVSTETITPLGSYTLTITGTSGTLQHSTTVGLTVTKH